MRSGHRPHDSERAEHTCPTWLQDVALALREELCFTIFLQLCCHRPWSLKPLGESLSEMHQGAREWRFVKHVKDVFIH
jgi:tryptophan 2,3-dioxygenase